MKFFKLNPITQKRLSRFKATKRGYISFWILVTITLLSFMGELFINNKALVVKYNDSYYFPILRSIPIVGINKQYTGKNFGEDYTHQAQYKELKEKWEKEGSKNWILMPLIPYSAGESDPIDMDALKSKVEQSERHYKKLIAQTKDPLKIKLLKTEKVEKRNQAYQTAFHPLAPSIAKKHYLGTDPIGRDILAQLVFGYRIAIVFALSLLFFSYLIGVSVGCTMGYYGSWVDLLGQRGIEILSRVPFIFIIMIIGSTTKVTFGILLSLMILFQWMGISWQMRTATYREKSRDYIMAAKSLGASNMRIIFTHIIPSTISLIVTFIPFSISGSIIALTSLDFLGFGLPPGTPSWGELLKMGTRNMDAPWIVASVVVAMVFVLFIINLIGESIREAFDPKKFTKYE
jgi:microcin C transport system permease protein